VSPEYVVIFTRAAILIIAALAGVMCIYLGWRLFFEGAKSRTDLEITHASFKVLLKASTPGLFFTFFGVGLLIFSINNRLELSVVEGGTSTTKSRAEDSGWPVPKFQTVATTPTERTAAQAQAPASAQKGADSGGCKYKSIDIKWFDTPDPRPESVVIVEALDVAVSAISANLRASPSGSNAAQQRKTILVLMHVKRGFE
jgi:hypothetical protein